MDGHACKHFALATTLKNNILSPESISQVFFIYHVWFMWDKIHHVLLLSFSSIRIIHPIGATFSRYQHTTYNKIFVLHATCFKIKTRFDITIFHNIYTNFLLCNPHRVEITIFSVQKWNKIDSILALSIYI